jgi:hypothetical protein
MLKFSQLAAFSLLFLSLFAVRSLAAQPDAQQDAPASTAAKVPVTTVVTVLGPNFTAPPALTKQDVIVHTGKQREEVTKWVAAQGDEGALDLAILIDDLDPPSMANQFGDVRAFIRDQGKNTRIGIYYADNGTSRLGVNFTLDHDAASKALRLPLGFGAASVSIYQSLLDLMSKWPASSARREVLVIGDGIDRFRGDPSSPDVALTIEKAQKGGIIIHSLYVRAVDHFGRNMFRLNYGLFNLGQMSDKTGGESFAQGTESPVSFAPYLMQLDMVLHNQYFLTFTTTRSKNKKGDLRDFRIDTEEHNVDISHAGSVFVPGTPK